MSGQRTRPMTGAQVCPGCPGIHSNSSPDAMPEQRLTNEKARHLRALPRMATLEIAGCHVSSGSGSRGPVFRWRLQLRAAPSAFAVTTKSKKGVQLESLVARGS